MHDKNWAWTNYLSARALAQAENIRMQLQRTMERFEIDLVSSTDQRVLYAKIREALVCGFFMQVAKREKGQVYRTMKDNNQAVMLHPSTVLQTEYDWVIYNEFVLTTKQYIRTVTGIRPEWLLELAENYYDVDSWDGQPDVKQALKQVADRMRRRAAMKAGR